MVPNASESNENIWLLTYYEVLHYSHPELIKGSNFLGSSGTSNLKHHFYHLGRFLRCFFCIGFEHHFPKNMFQTISNLKSYSRVFVVVVVVVMWCDLHVFAFQFLLPTFGFLQRHTPISMQNIDFEKFKPVMLAALRSLHLVSEAVFFFSKKMVGFCGLAGYLNQIDTTCVRSRISRYIWR